MAPIYPRATRRSPRAGEGRHLQGRGREFYQALRGRGKGSRSKPEIERCLKRYVYPEWGAEQFRDINREQVADLLDKIVDENIGPVQADRVLAIIRKLMNWYATRTDGYTSPIVRGHEPHQG